MKYHDRLLRLLIFAVVALFLAGLSGRLSAHLVNDSPSYLEYPTDSIRGAMLSYRTPGYPVFLAIVVPLIGVSIVPALQVMLHAVAAWSLWEELLDRKMPMVSAVAASICVLIGCTPTDHVNTISTDCPAASLGVLTAVGLLRATRTQLLRDWLICGALALLVVTVRPAYLFVIPWLAIAGWLLERHDRVAGVLRDKRTILRYRGAMVASFVLVVVIGWMTARKLVVNEFGLVPFGHQNLSAMLVQTVPLKTLRELPGEGGELARIVADRLEADGFESPTDKTGFLPTMTFEQQWDVINYTIVIPSAQELETERKDSDDEFMVRVHRRIGAMNRAILAASPKGYLRWLALGVRRSVWGTAANVTMHPVFLGVILIAIGGLLVRVSSGASIPPLVIPPGWTALTTVALTYAILKLGFVILSSPPLGRFADAAAIFLPAVVAALVSQPRRASLDRATRRLFQPS